MNDTTSFTATKFAPKYTISEPIIFQSNVQENYIQDEPVNADSN